MAQDFGKQVVIAIPNAFSIQCHHKQVSALERLQHLLALSLLPERITKGRTELIEQTGDQ